MMFSSIAAPVAPKNLLLNRIQPRFASRYEIEPPADDFRLLKKIGGASYSPLVREVEVSINEKGEVVDAHTLSYMPEKEKNKLGTKKIQLVLEQVLNSFIGWHRELKSFVQIDQVFYTFKDPHNGERKKSQDLFLRRIGDGEQIENMLVDQEKGRLLDLSNGSVTLGKTGNVYQQQQGSGLLRLIKRGARN